MVWFTVVVVVVVVVVVFRVMVVICEIEKAEQHVQTNSDQHSIQDECYRSGRTQAAVAAVVHTGNARGASTVEIITYFAVSAFTLASYFLCAGDAVTRSVGTIFCANCPIWTWSAGNLLRLTVVLSYHTILAISLCCLIVVFSISTIFAI